MRLRTCAIFESDSFNTTDSKPEYVHPDNFGDDVGRWLMQKLRDRGIPVDESDPSQEDHGWYVTFGPEKASHDAVVIYVPTSTTPRWLLCVERSLGVLGTMFGRRTRSVLPTAIESIDRILKESAEVRHVRWLWFDDVRRRNLDNGTEKPFATESV